MDESYHLINYGGKNIPIFYITQITNVTHGYLDSSFIKVGDVYRLLAILDTDISSVFGKNFSRSIQTKSKSYPLTNTNDYVSIIDFIHLLTTSINNNWYSINLEEKYYNFRDYMLSKLSRRRNEQMDFHVTSLIFSLVILAPVWGNYL